MDLKSLQHWMKWIITHPEGVHSTIENRKDEPMPSAWENIKDQPPLSKADRLSIYSGAYFIRLLECLQKDFSITYKLLGEELFHHLIADYLKAHPSQSYNIGEVGKHLFHFTEGHPFQNEIPWLKEIIRLEWLIIQSFYEKSPEGFSLEILEKIPPEKQEDMIFKISPMVRIFSSDFSLFHAWENHQNLPQEDLIGQLISTPTFFLIYRKNFHILLEEISENQYAILQRLSDGAKLGDIVETFPSAPLGDFFRSWIEKGIIDEIQ